MIFACPIVISLEVRWGCLSSLSWVFVSFVFDQAYVQRRVSFFPVVGLIAHDAYGQTPKKAAQR